MGSLASHEGGEFLFLNAGGRLLLAVCATVNPIHQELRAKPENLAGGMKMFLKFAIKRGRCW
jgi:hypothetical protein